jgi:hypothetical protein
MKLEILRSLGRAWNLPLMEGDVAEVPEEKAALLLASGLALKVIEEAQPVAAPVETVKPAAAVETKKPKS